MFASRVPFHNIRESNFPLWVFAQTEFVSHDHHGNENKKQIIIFRHLLAKLLAAFLRNNAEQAIFFSSNFNILLLIRFTDSFFA